MARQAQLITAADREKAADSVYSTDPTEITDLGDRDAEDAWNDWQEALRSSEAGGLIHAHRLPTDSDGNPLQGKGARFSHLGSWDHQLFSFEELVEKLRREFIKPGERAHIKLTGMVKGKRGSMFSQIVTIERAAVSTDGAGGESVSQLFRLMQEGQQQNAQMLREIIQPAIPTAQTPSRSFSDTAKEFTAILAPIVGPILAAWIARPAKPKSDLAELVGAMSQMKDFISGKSDNDDSESGTLATIIKAVAPALPDLAKVLASSARPMAMPARPALSAPAHVASIPTPAARPVAISPAAVSVESSRVQENSPSGVTNEMISQIKPHLEELATLAEEKQDPKEVAKLLISMLPETMLQILDNLVQDKATFQRLALLSPKVKLHAEWFESLRQAIDSELEQGDSDESQKEG